MPGNLVCMNALCACNKGAAPTPLTVTSQQLRTVNNQLVATVMDFAPIVNIKPFGICQQLTNLASGVPTPCVPVPVGPWSPGSAIETITNLAVLTADSKLTCGVGGEITIKFPNCTLELTVK